MLIFRSLDGVTCNSSSAVSFPNPTLANYYSQAGQGTNPGSLPGLSGLVSQSTVNGPQSIPGIVPLSLSQYASPGGTYPPTGEYRRPLPVIF